ncbi:hypothetical protein CHUAL_004489 [Chamberlinius hualienensis]
MYDGRGHLHDLSQYEAGENYEIPEEDRSMEELCDEERYSDLSKNLSDQDLYHEEELKRLRAALADDGTYNQVQFAYTDEVTDNTVSNNDDKSSCQESKDSNDHGQSKFMPPADLNIPDGMEVPSTIKVNTIIEKTAMFVCRHSAQMEIVIKTKQANNPQFGFLSFDHSLNPYYKLMVQAIKSGKYIPKEQTTESSDEDDSDDEHYLHPSLLAGSQMKAPEVFSVPKIAYAKTGEDRYSLLVNQLKDKVYADLAEVQRSSPKPVDGAQTVACPNMDSSIPPPPGLEPVMLPPPDANSQSSNSGEDVSVVVVVPPADIVPVVEKLATYVAKNGEDFEAVVKAKARDPRFEFLNSDHIYYPYYRQRLRIMQKDYGPKLQNEHTFEKDGSKSGVVSFSIKMKDGVEKKGFFTITEPQTESSKKVEGPNNCNLEESADAIRIRAELQEARLAEERIRDRLAAAARERLAIVSKEKQIQLERKRKAAMFLSMLQNKGDKGETSNLIGPRLPTQAEIDTVSNGDGDKFASSDSMPPNLPDSASYQVMTAVSQATLSACSAPDTVISSDDKDTAYTTSDLREQPKKSSSSSHKKSRHRDRSKSRSRSRSRRHRRSRSRSSSSELRSRKINRSRERKRRRHYSSSSPEVKSKKHEKRRSSRTPPASYMRVRNTSTSPRRRSRSRSKSRNRHSRHSRS